MIRASTRTLAGVLTAAALWSGAAFAAPVAGANTPADEKYLDLVAQLEIPVASDEAAINIGNEICTMLDAGRIEPHRTVRGVLSRLMSQGLSKGQAANLMWGATGTYCPQFSNIVGR